MGDKELCVCVGGPCHGGTMRFEPFGFELPQIFEQRPVPGMCRHLGHEPVDVMRHEGGRYLGQRHPNAFGNKRYRSGCPWIHFQNVHFVSLDRKLDIHQPYYAQLQRHFTRLVTHYVLHFLVQVIGRE